MPATDAWRSETILKFAGNRPLAHEALFGHRHRDETPEFHKNIIEFLHGRHADGVILAFRDAAKSTIAEEDIILDACLQRFHNCVIVGASEKRAIERLAAIKREIETNEFLREVFGDQVGQPWQETKIVLKNGRCVQAIGRDQAVRGLKYLDWRPDRILVDDVEDRESVQTPEGRRKTMIWFMAELLPAADVNCRIRVLATPMDKESVPQRLIDDMKWPRLVIPIEYKGGNGERVPSWPARFPLSRIDERMEAYRLSGTMHIWAAEMMCQAVSEADRVFSTLPVVPRQRTWEACYAMIDPARTTHHTSASTGIVVWSWVGGRLIVWRARAEIWKPDEIIKHLFWLDDRFRPIWIGFEEDGLNEWALQPIRQEQIRRGRTIPLKPMKAPRSKLDFIKGLHPFAEAGEIVLAEECPDLNNQLASFPSGRIDVPNALAYALMMRPAHPIYDNWSQDHIAESLDIEMGFPAYLACNASNALTTAVLFQVIGRQTRIVADFAAEGDAADAVGVIQREAAMLAPDARWVVGPGHWEQYTNAGLVQAIRGIPRSVVRAIEPSKGREELRELFDRRLRDMPVIRISRHARLTLNAIAGGYTRTMRRDGTLSPDPEPGLYRTLMEGLESAIGMTARAEDADIGEAASWAYTRDGRRYRRYALATDRR